MKSWRSGRIVLGLLVAVLLPLGQSRCTLMVAHADPVTVHTEQHDRSEHHGGPESHPNPTSPTAPCCCDHILAAVATTPASVSVDAPTSTLAPLALVPVGAATLGAPSGFVRLEPDARSGSPPDPSTAPQSPRGPPYSV